MATPYKKDKKVVIVRDDEALERIKSGDWVLGVLRKGMERFMFASVRSEKEDVRVNRGKNGYALENELVALKLSPVKLDEDGNPLSRLGEVMHIFRNDDILVTGKLIPGMKKGSAEESNFQFLPTNSNFVRNTNFASLHSLFLSFSHDSDSLMLQSSEWSKMRSKKGPPMAFGWGRLGKRKETTPSM